MFNIFGLLLALVCFVPSAHAGEAEQPEKQTSLSYGSFVVWVHYCGSISRCEKAIDSMLAYDIKKTDSKQAKVHFELLAQRLNEVVKRNIEDVVKSEKSVQSQYHDYRVLNWGHRLHANDAIAPDMKDLDAVLAESKSLYEANTYNSGKHGTDKYGWGGIIKCASELHYLSRAAKDVASLMKKRHQLMSRYPAFKTAWEEQVKRVQQKIDPGS